MKRRLRIKNRNKQIVAKLRVKFHAGIDVGPQSNVALNNDQCAGLGRSETRRRQNNFIVDGLPKLAATTRRQTKTIAEGDQPTAHLSLKQYDDRKAYIEERAAQHKLERRQSLVHRQPIKKSEDCQGRSHRRRARATQELEYAVNEKENEHDVYQRTRLRQLRDVIPDWKYQKQHAPSSRPSF